ncbi:ABC transporter permease subunit [Murimonas intestini]|uniref:ABC-2 family transporter n=1 Tax=Murimonas intestini TaxID=1337051 RepID=A0AB73SYJ6_9FIRM|nr:ABC transporter permease subunit [Murimonas intestini]MCR1840269.1 ABC transporter permease [Murimonas intestini]MCR1868267.1 ABC transporter permease [Murimonas intestini]MCR1885617.1 ABC transporter permease [Murimonas intestini]
MSKLLNANFARLKKEKVFWITVVFMVIYAAGVCIWAYSRGSGIKFDGLFLYVYGLGGQAAVPGIVMAVLCSMFIGTEYSDGTVRNKLVVGRTRFEIYASNFITCAAAGIFLNVVCTASICAVGIPLFGGFAMPAGMLIQIIITGVLIMVSYAALFNMLAMLLTNKTSSSVLSLILAIAVMFAAAYMIARLAEPEITDLYSLVDGQFTVETGPNPFYIGGMARVICQVFVNLFPSGQSLQLSSEYAELNWTLPLYSAGVIIAANAAGLSGFIRKDLK